MSIINQSGTDFFLTGGTALSRAYFNHRYSDDLDFFLSNSETFDEQLDAVLDLLKENGYNWNTEKEFIRAERFTTLKVRKDSDFLLKLDFVNDTVPIFGDIEKTDLFHRTDSVRNILSNKLSAIFRYEAKDIADIREIALHEKVDWITAIQEARQKDAGLELIYVSEILKSMPEKDFEKIIWVNKVTWKDFRNDIEKIALEMLKGQSDNNHFYSLKSEDSEVNEALPDYNKLYTVEDYHSWDENFRAELYEGALIVSEAPSVQHQRILMEISSQLHTYLKGKPCEVFPSPFAVRLFDNEETIFEPDIVVVCDKSKLDKRRCNGPPDMIIEILSPTTARMDKKLKFGKYQKSGVKEYWIIDPVLNLLEANVLVNNKYTTTIYDENEKAPVFILEGLEIDLAEVFAE